MKNNRPTTRAPRSLTSLILGSSLFLGGLQQSCTTPGEQLARGEITREEYEARIERQGAELTSLLGGVVSGLGAQRGDPGAVMFGQAISGLGAASAGRSDVRQNVNVYQPGTENQTRQNSQPGNQTGQNSQGEKIRVTIRDTLLREQIVLEGLPNQTISEIFMASPRYQREKAMSEFRRKQIINSGGVILYESGGYGDEPYHITNIFSGEKDIKIGLIFPIKKYEENDLLLNIANIETQRETNLGNIGDGIIHEKIHFTHESASDSLEEGELYRIYAFKPQKLMERIGEGKEFILRIYFAKENEDLTNIKPYSERRFIIDKDMARNRP